MSDGPRLFLGNDVVDLDATPAHDPQRQRRFLERVFTRDERTRIAGAPDPGLELWLLWAAKEAAFKAVTKEMGRAPVFVHRAFEVEGGAAGSDLPGTVRYEGRALPWVSAGSRATGAVHVVAWAAEGSRKRDPTRSPGTIRGGTAELEAGAGIPRDRFTDRERRPVRSPASAWVRLHARGHLAGLAGLEEEAVEIVCPEGPPGRVPPRVLVRGGESAWDVTLSHHGRWLAWVLGRPGGEGAGDAVRAPGFGEGRG